MNNMDTTPPGTGDTRLKTSVDTDQPTPDLYGDELRQLLKDRDLSQKELARRAGVDRPSISLACTATRRLSPDSQRKVARALELAEDLSERPPRAVRDATTAHGGEPAKTLRLVAGQRQKVDYPEGGDLRDSGATRASNNEENGRDGRTVEVIGLKNYRALKRLNKSELARRAGLSTQTVRQVEKKGTATPKTARMLASALGVGIDDLAEAEQKGRFGDKLPSSTPSSETSSVKEADRNLSDGGTGPSHDPDGPSPLTAVGSYVDPSGASRPVVAVSSLKAIRQARGLSQSKLARETGLGQATIGRLEKRGRAALDNAQRLASALGVGLEELAGYGALAGSSEKTSGPGSDEGTMSCKGQRVSSEQTSSSPAQPRGPLKIEVSEEVLKRVDRVLDILETLLGRRRS